MNARDNGPSSARPSALAAAPALSSLPSLATLVLAACLLSACGSGSSGVAPVGDGGNGGGDPSAAIDTLDVSLKSLDDSDPCGDLQQFLRDYAEQTMRRQLSATRDAQIDYPYGGPVPVLSSGAASGTGSAGAPATAPTGASGQVAADATTAAGRFTTTNLQTAGIDEPDTVKNDDRNLYQLHRQSGANGGAPEVLVLSKSRYWPADQMTVLGQTALPSFEPGFATGTRGMFVTERAQAIVLRSYDASVYPLAIDVVARNNADVAVPASGAAVSSAASVAICPASGCRPIDGRSVTRMDVFDVSADAAPAPIATIEVGGRLIDARRRGDRLWLVTSQAFIYPSWLKWWPANLDYQAPAATRRAQFDQLIATNSAAIRASALGDWLPAEPGVDRAQPPTRAECARYRKVSEPSELGWLRVVSVDLADRSVSQQVIMAQGQMVYASASSLYVGTPNWRGHSDSDPGPATFVHKFAIDKQGVASYAASGVYRGAPLSPYSFDEDANGSLRFAANALMKTEVANPPQPGVVSSVSWQPYTYVGTMRPDEANPARLKVAGKSPPIAVGERMQSVRFVGTRAYLVTFRQVDPLFVFDVGAATPVQLGELKVPGFSTYLHPIDGNHLLGIGYDGGGWPRRIKASLFDVTDPANPREQSTVVVGEFFSGSEALWDPHAFSYLPRDATGGTIAIPLWSYPWIANGRQSSSLELLNVSTVAGLSPGGAVTVDDLLVGTDPYFDNSDRYVRRSVLADGFAFAIGNKLVRSVAIADPGRTLGTLLVP